MVKPEVIPESNQRKWSQGCLLKATFIKSSWLVLTNNETVPLEKNDATGISNSRLNWQIEHKTLEDNDLLVVISQTCDIRRLSSKEPYVETIRAFWTEDKCLINEAKTNSVRH